jgi:hypothetical protein
VYKNAKIRNQMKRYSITEIIGKVQLQTLTATGRPNALRYFVMTRKAAVNEILRMEAEEEAERAAR